MTNIQLGSVSTETFRNQDLIPTYIEEVKKYCPTEYEQLLVNNSLIPSYVKDEGDESDWWDSEEVMFLRTELEDLLNSVAPPFCHFGSNEGNGSDIGFWTDSRQIYEGISYGEICQISDLDDIDKLDEDGEVFDYYLLVKDHGLMTLYDAERKEVWSII